MPPKRRTPAKSAPAPAKPAPPPAPPQNTPKPTPQAAKPAPPPAPAPVPAPPPPPPPPVVETPSAKVRKEWQNFLSSWYEPEKKKLIDQLTKELDLKYKKATSKIQQTARHAEKEKKLSEIATQLAEPAHEEWNNRLAAVQLLVDDWTDITEQEQQSVISVFVVFFQDDDDNEDVVDPTALDSNEMEESLALALAVEESHFADSSPLFAARQSPPTPVTANFQLVNPSSFFTDTIPPLNQARKLPELAMDNLALNNLNTGRSQPDPGPSTSAVFGFQGWASEVSLAVPQSNNRNRATDNISRQVSAASASSPLFSSGTAPHYSPPQPTSKISPLAVTPLAVTHMLAPGKRYIGPVIAEEEAEPVDEDILRAKMAAEFLEFKMNVRIQMIQEFHDKASEIEIELFKQLESNNSSRESRLRTLQEHEENMMSLRESKEMERKRLCDQERDRRLQEHQFLKQAAAQKVTQTRLNASASSSKTPLNNPATQSGWSTHSAPKLAGQKENLSTGSMPTTVPKPDPPSILKKSISARSQDVLPGFDEAAFFKAQAEAASMAKGKQPAATATASTSNPLGRPSALKKTESTSSQDEPVELVVPPPPPTTQAPSAAKGKKGKKAAAATQQTKTVTFNEEPDADAEPPPVWGAKNAKGGVRPSLSSKPSKSVMIEEEPDEDADPLFTAWNAKNARSTTPAAVSTKKGKAAVVAEEVNVDPSPPAASAFGWGSTGGWASGAAAGKKAKAPMVPPTEPMEDPFQTWNGQGSGWGSASASAKKTKVTVTEALDEEVPSPAVSTAWGAGKTVSSSSKQPQKVVPQPEPRRGAQSSLSKCAWVQDAEEEEDEDEDEEEEVWSEVQPASAMPGGIDAASEEEGAWGASYWGNLAKGQPVSQVPEEPTISAQHMRWTPSMDTEESGDEDSGAMDESMEGALWMQYAISGGEIPGFQVPDVQEHAPVKSTAASNSKPTTSTSKTSIWEQGKGTKKSAPANETVKIEPTRPQQTSNARTAQWPKASMENWASRLGQSSGSARHL
ncbi:hypothetical protein DFH29DRAFT_1005974 [Suillus ampliporus]|nr:hypothetical protein DFH29DRAFT_1005974 [Suillus ampliporus]